MAGRAKAGQRRLQELLVEGHEGEGVGRLAFIDQVLAVGQAGGFVDAGQDVLVIDDQDPAGIGVVVQADECGRVRALVDQVAQIVAAG